MFGYTRKTIVYAVVLLLFFAAVSTVDAHSRHRKTHDHNISYSLNHFDSPLHHNSPDLITVKLKNNSIIFTNYDDNQATVKFTENYELFINNKQIELNDDQRKLVKEFYEQAIAVKKYAKEIGIEGAKIGLDGVMVGLKAIGCVFKLLSPSYDTEDLEKEIERAADEIEHEADLLEKKAEKIEDMIDDLDDLSREMVDEIPELEQIGWF